MASDFDEQTLSAVAWLNSNQVDISCYRVWPSKLDDKIILQTDKVLPVTDYDDFYVDIVGNPSMTKGTDEKAVLQKDGQVVLTGDTKESIQQWLKSVYGWSSVETYAFAVDEKTGKTLSDLRKEYLETQSKG